MYIETTDDQFPHCCPKCRYEPKTVYRCCHYLGLWLALYNTLEEKALLEDKANHCIIDSDGDSWYFWDNLEFHEQVSEEINKHMLQNPQYYAYRIIKPVGRETKVKFLFADLITEESVTFMFTKGY